MPLETLNKKTIYMLMSVMNAQHRIPISKFIMDRGSIPIYPSIISDFYPISKKLATGLDRETNDDMIKRADELWVFGELSNKMVEEIKSAKRLGKGVKYFDIAGMPRSIREITENEVKFEKGFRIEK